MKYICPLFEQSVFTHARCRYSNCGVSNLPKSGVWKALRRVEVVEILVDERDDVFVGRWGPVPDEVSRDGVPDDE